jgi:hypothetical protein
VTTPLDTTYGTANFAYLADVNGDGKADLIFANFVPPTSGTTWTIYLETQLGKGDGTFGTASQAKVESFNVNAPIGVFLNAQYDIAVGDINGDGKMDIALAVSEILTNASGAWVVTTAFGNNDGTFTGLGTKFPSRFQLLALRSFQFWISMASILTFADVNGDGKPDLVANVGNSTLDTALGNGDGTFSAAVTTDISAIAQPDSAVLLDVNNDGKPDLIVAGGTLGVFLGNGDGTFTPPVTGSQYVTDFTPGLRPGRGGLQQRRSQRRCSARQISTKTFHSSSTPAKAACMALLPSLRKTTRGRCTVPCSPAARTPRMDMTARC